MVLYTTVSVLVFRLFAFFHANGTADLLGVPDKDVWNYGQTLRALAIEKGFEHISFSRLRDLVSINLPDTLDEMTYVANATNFRRVLLNTFSRPDWDWDVVSQSEDVCLTYRGYLKFLETDLATVYPIEGDRTKSQFRKGLKYIAREMMARGDVSQTFLILFIRSSLLTWLFPRHSPALSDRNIPTTSASLSTLQLVQ